MHKLLFYIILFFSLHSNAFSASVYLEGKKEVSLNQENEVTILLNSENQSFNVFDFAISFNEDKFEFAGYNAEKSLIKDFIVKPYSKNGITYFEGIIPNGVSEFYDTKNSKVIDLPLVVLKFNPKKTGETSLTFKKVNIYKNDGLGTLVNPRTSPYNLNIEDKGYAKEHKETAPPKFSRLELIKLSNEDADYMLIFDAIDLESGVSHFKIKRKNEFDIITSPQYISKKIFPQRITLRAYDFADNYAEETISIPSMLKLPYILFGLFVIIIYFIYKRLI